jgi:lipoprotein Spr
LPNNSSSKDNSGDGGSLLVNEAMTWLGTPYRYGGQDYTGTDCSGLTMKVYQKALGISIPRTTVEQQKFCLAIQKNSLSVGDLVFFSTGRDKSRVSHVGIYIGDGKFIHASSTKGVIISNIGELYYVNNYHSSGHVQRPSDSKIAVREQKKEEIKKDVPSVKFSEIKQSIEVNEAIESKIDSIYGSFIY